MRPERRERGSAVLVTLLLAAFAIQAGIAALRDSVTVDELAHLPVGLYFLRHGDFSPDPINPPLSRMLPALAILSADARLDPPAGADEWQMGLRFMRDNVDDYHGLYVRSRTVVIGFGLLLGLLVYRWSRELYGSSAGLIALTLFAFSPTMLAHGHLVTVDMAGTLGFAAGVRQVARHRVRPGLVAAAGLGALVASALLLKLSCLPLLVLAAIALLWPTPVERLPIVTRLGHALAAAVVTLAVLAAGYGFQGVAEPLGTIAFVPGGGLGALAARFPNAWIPLPEALLRGLDLIASAELKGDRSFYLAGEISERGWWYYHFVAYALKTPLPLLAAIALAATTAVRGSGVKGEGILWIAAAVVFVTGGILNPLKLGIRHVMAAEIFLIVLAAGALAAALRAWQRGERDSAAVASVALVALLLAGHVASSVAQAPRSIAYFNALAGGPSHGHEWLADSNLDWGQDLVRLREQIAARGLGSVELAYFGTVHPGAYGIAFEPLRAEPSSRPKIVSASLLVGLPFRIWQTPDSWSRVDPQLLETFAEREPSGRIGSLFLFEAEEPAR